MVCEPDVNNSRRRLTDGLRHNLRSQCHPSWRKSAIKLKSLYCCAKLPRILCFWEHFNTIVITNHTFIMQKLCTLFSSVLCLWRTIYIYLSLSVTRAYSCDIYIHLALNYFEIYWYPSAHQYIPHNYIHLYVHVRHPWMLLLASNISKPESMQSKNQIFKCLPDLDPHGT